jgi:hypothetical protein
LVDNPKNHSVICTKLHELGYPGHQVKFVLKEAPARSAVPAETEGGADSSAGSSRAAEPTAAVRSQAKPVAKSFDPKDFKNDPLIAKALEMFKGQIADTRV